MLIVRPVQTVYQNAGNVSSTAVSFPYPVTKGNLKLCYVGLSGGTSLNSITVSDNIDGSYTAEGNEGGANDVSANSLINAKPGLTTVTVSGVTIGSGTLVVFIMEWSGCSKTTHTLIAGSQNFGTSATPSSGGISRWPSTAGLVVTGLALSGVRQVSIALTDQFNQIGQGHYGFVPGSPTNDVFACIYRTYAFNAKVLLNGLPVNPTFGDFQLSSSATWVTNPQVYQAISVGPMGAPQVGYRGEYGLPDADD